MAQDRVDWLADLGIGVDEPSGFVITQLVIAFQWETTNSIPLSISFSVIQFETLHISAFRLDKNIFIV
jgi:hypothetical protein